MAALRPGEEPEDDELDIDEVDTDTGEEEVEETDAETEPAETDAEPDPAAASEETEEADEPPPKPASRAARRIQALDERLKRTERELAEARRRPAGPDPNALAEQQRREAAEEEAVRLRGDPAEMSQFYATRAERRLDQRLNQVAFHSADASDRTTFQTLANANSLYASVADEVEDRLAQARAAGMNPQRIAIAHLLLGERVAKRSKPAATRQRRQAEASNARQTARPGNSRSDVTASRRPSGDTQAKRASRLDESGLL